jgi:hypothetical protein
VVSKICPYDGGVCRRVSCDEILANGFVAVCERHRNSRGRFTRRKVVFSV